MRKPQTLSELNPSPYNPRKISKKAAKGLARSLEKYGDISGITYNLKTDRLVCGHQRVNELAKAGARLDGDEIVANNGERFKIRFVDWDENIEAEANIIANNGAICGGFIPEVNQILNDIRQSIEPSDYEKMLFDACRFGDDESTDDAFKIVVECSSRDDRDEKIVAIQNIGIDCRAA